MERWLAQFGAEGTRALLKWNLRPAPVHARLRATDAPPPEWLEASAWPGWYLVKSGHWAEVGAALSAGRIYLADPATRLAIEATAPRAGERVIDACAAPGGKSLALADMMGEGLLVALDVPGARHERLAENLKRMPPRVSAKRVEGDLRRATSLMGMTPGDFDAVLVDAPCSNTGVMRHRVDVKWRLQPADFGKHARQQVELLAAATRWLKPGGRLVYSTCSIDAEENSGVVESFRRLPEARDFELVSHGVTLPWVAGHDGAGIALFRRKG